MAGYITLEWTYPLSSWSNLSFRWSTFFPCFASDIIPAADFGGNFFALEEWFQLWWSGHIRLMGDFHQPNKPSNLWEITMKNGGFRRMKRERLWPYGASFLGRSTKWMVDVASHVWLQEGRPYQIMRASSSCWIVDLFLGSFFFIGSISFFAFHIIGGWDKHG